MPGIIHLTVATVIHRDGRFLLVRERGETGREVVNQPAGHVEPGETLEQAALREVLEETRWRVELTGFLGIATYRSPHNGETYYRMNFCAEPLAEQTEGKLDAGIIGTVWWDPDTIAGHADRLRSPMVLATVENFLAGPIYPLDMIKNFSGTRD
jgi:ADP-ribose pyrophosphatase YjhB (NUDIX family)